VQNNLAYLYSERLNQLDKAYELARKARTGVPANAGIADTLGWILYKRGDYQQALELLQQAAAGLPGIPEVQYHVGMAYSMMGNVEAARAAFAVAAKGDIPIRDEATRRLTLLDDFKDRSPPELEKMLSQQPTDVLLQLRLAEAWEKEGASEKAAAAYEQALKLNPKLGSAFARLARLKAGPLKQSDEALALAKKARELAPNDPFVAGTLGVAAYKSGNLSLAYPLLQEGSRQFPNDPEMLHALAWAAYRLAQTAEARETMQRLVNAAPASEFADDAKSFLAMTALEQGTADPSHVEPNVERVLTSDPGYVPALMARAAIQRQRGEGKPASATYQEVLRIFPDFAPAQKRLAALYLDDPTQSSQAYEIAQKARKTLARDPELAQILGIASYHRKEYPQAIQFLQQSGTDKPLDANALYYLGMSHIRAGQKSQGQQALEKAVAAGLKEPLASEATRLLGELRQE
jgi:tetratricopeptide (TPR) repeat protein